MSTTPIDCFRCPICDGLLSWSCPSGDGKRGRAHCQDGRTVSRRWPGRGEPCRWTGTPVLRVAAGDVVVELPAMHGVWAT